MARAAPPLRTFLVAGTFTALVALALAHGYRAVYLAAGGEPFAEINAITTTLAVVVPAILATAAYSLAGRWIPRARPVYSIAALALTVLSLAPVIAAPLHPGFGALALPLHILVGGALALGLPAFVAHASERPARTRGPAAAP